MSTDIYCYTETLNDSKQWEADNRHTFLMATAPGNDAWPEMLPNYDGRNYALFGLICMGVRNTAFPFSFAQKGFPKNASREVTAMFLDKTDARNPSWLTREDLEGKLGELTILSDQRALAIRPHLVEFLQALPEYHGPSKNQRIVFWFDGE